MTQPDRRAFLKTLLAGALAGPACRRSSHTATDLDPEANFKYQKLLVPENGLYTGAFIEFGDREDDVSLEKIDAFEQMVGKKQAIVASSSYWGEGTFPDANLRLIARHGSIPLVYWSPWDRPYDEGMGPDRFSLTSIIAGDHDAYLDMWGDKARELAWPIMVSFANEMNGSWFPWSGAYYGGATPIPNTKPQQYEGPEIFKKAWRHVVDRVRSRNASNVIWVLHVMNFSDPNDKWNMAPNYYPGPDYVDWMGMSLYGSQFPADKEWAPFPPLLDWPYTEIASLDPKKPMMLCEWGCAELPNLGDRAEWIREAFRLMKDPLYHRLKAAVVWHERWQNSDPDNAPRYSNLRVNSSAAALEAYQKGVADPYYLGEPQLAETKGR